MTQKFYYLSLFLGLVCGMCFTSCCDTDDVTPIVPGGGGEEVTLYLDNEALPAGIIDPATGTIQLTEGGELTLPFVVEPAELASKIVLSSADPSIVEVNGMKLIAKKPGKTTIYATAGNYTMQYDVEVKEKEIANAYLKWDDGQKKLVPVEIPETAITVSSLAGGVACPAGTYVVEGQVTISGVIILQGDVNLIIKDDAKLTAKGIRGYNNNLRIYGQAQKSGELVVDGLSDAIYEMSTLEVHSAKVTATSSNNNSGGFFDIKTFNVYGGSVDGEGTATDGYGILLTDYGKMNIYGGDVKAEGSGNGYSFGIRSGYYGATVTVSGGTLWAKSAANQAIGSNVTLTKGDGFSGKIEYSMDKSAWSETADASAKYVRVGY